MKTVWMTLILLSTFVLAACSQDAWPPRDQAKKLGDTVRGDKPAMPKKENDTVEHDEAAIAKARKDAIAHFKKLGGTIEKRADGVWLGLRFRT